MSTNYYEILGITIYATSIEIKKAYIVLIKEFPAETYPEKFKQIRQAYEVLGNEKTRREYDTLSEYGTEIETNLAEGLKCMDDNNYGEAESFFKKILILEPSFTYIRNYYALCLTYQNDTEKAIKQYQRIMKEEPDNTVYLTNYALALKRDNRLEESISILELACEIDKSDTYIFFLLIDMYCHLQQFHTAVNKIEYVLLSTNEEKFYSFEYLLKLVEVYIRKKEDTRISQTLLRIKNLLSRFPGEREYAAHEIAKLVYKLNRTKLFEQTALVMEMAAEIDPRSESIQGLRIETMEKKLVYREYEDVQKESVVLPAIKDSLLLYLFGDEVSGEEYEEFNEKMKQAVIDSCRFQSEEMIQSVKRIMIHYPQTYEVRKEFFKQLITMAKDFQQKTEQYTLLKNDYEITNSNKRLVALYLSSINGEERKFYFDDILDEAEQEDPDLLLQSIKKLKTQYPKLYELNTSIFDELERISKL